MSFSECHFNVLIIILLKNPTHDVILMSFILMKVTLMNLIEWMSLWYMRLWWMTFKEIFFYRMSYINMLFCRMLFDWLSYYKFFYPQSLSHKIDVFLVNGRCGSGECHLSECCSAANVIVANAKFSSLKLLIYELVYLP